MGTYLSRNGGLFGATEQPLPARLNISDLCGQCHARNAQYGDWLCRQCRNELEQSLKPQEEEDRDATF